ncbi:hypothetical protein GE09DRAFT_1156947 [Coniochaeta sp. 2T2.1]|nr:hypothetical protein GE09DRAFT_1156947 [Coniochaeta sp. 2T2.1]
MSPGYQRPAVGSEKVINDMLSSRPSSPSSIIPEDAESDEYRSLPLQKSDTRPTMSTRRHSDMPRGARSTRDRPWGPALDGEAEEEVIKANHARARSPSRNSRHRDPSEERKRGTVGHDAGEPNISTLHSWRRSPAKDDKRSDSPRSRARPDVLSFLDQDSPNLTAESIKRTLEASTQWHRDPRETSPRGSVVSSPESSVGQGSFRSGPDSDLDSQAHISPDSSVDGNIVSTTFVQNLSQPQHDLPRPDTKSTMDARPPPKKKQPKDKEYHYGTPEMPRGTANLPHLPPNALTPRVSNPGQGHVKHLPRAEKLPLTGYELLAARLSTTTGNSTSQPRRHRRRHQSSQPPSPSSSTSSGRSSPEDNRPAEPDLKPIYRRFEALNHRLLLHLQDELSELEEQLHRLDTADTQTRRLQNCILPASRRAGHMSGGELQWHKTDILGKIGFKLGQYNHALSSFTAAQGLPSPELGDVEAYRTYLARDNPIAEIETRFLDATDDLVSLARERSSQRRSGSRPGSGSSSPSSGLEDCERGRRSRYSPAAVSDEAPTPRQGSWASFVPKTTRFPFGGAPGVTSLPTPSLSPASSVAGSSRPGSSSARLDEREGAPASPAVSVPAGLPYLLMVVLILLPVLLLRIVEGLAARLMLVVVFASMGYALGQVLAVAGQQDQVPLLGTPESREVVMYAGVYGVAMAVVAALC